MKPNILARNPHTDAYAHLWGNLDDSSWLWRDLAQTIHNVDELHLLGQIGQLGINTSIVVFGLLFVFLTGLYENHEDDLAAQIGH